MTTEQFKVADDALQKTCNDLASRVAAHDKIKPDWYYSYINDRDNWQNIRVALYNEYLRVCKERTNASEKYRQECYRRYENVLGE